MFELQSALTGDTGSDRETTEDSTRAAPPSIARRKPIFDSIVTISSNWESVKTQGGGKGQRYLPRGRVHEHVVSSGCPYHSTLPMRSYEKSTNPEMVTTCRTLPSRIHSRDIYSKNSRFILTQQESGGTASSLYCHLHKARNLEMQTSMVGSSDPVEADCLCATTQNQSSDPLASEVSTMSKKASQDANRSNSSSGGHLVRSSDIYEVANSADLSRLPVRRLAAKSERVTLHPLILAGPSLEHPALVKSGVTVTACKVDNVDAKIQPPRTLGPSLGSPSRLGSGKMHEHSHTGGEDGLQRTLRSLYMPRCLQKISRDTEACGGCPPDQELRTVISAYEACPVPSQVLGSHKATTVQTHEATTTTPTQWSASYPKNVRNDPQIPQLTQRHRGAILKLTTKLDIGENTSSKSAKGDEDGDGEMVLPPQSAEAIPGSPMSLYVTTDNDSPVPQIDTPLTSPCVSPVKVDSIPENFIASGPFFAQVDGASEGEKSTSECEHERSASRDRDSLCLEQSAETSGMDMEADHPTIDLTQIDQQILRFEDLDIDPEDETPFAKESKANASAFPCLPQDPGSHHSPKLATQRHPSKFLRFNEQYATPRQRDLRVGSLETPDRFIPGRSATPNKEALLLRKPAKRNDGTRQLTPAGVSSIADPFGPNLSRSARTADRFATVRRSPTLPRLHGTSGTSVPEAFSATRRAISSSAVWTVGGVVVTEGVASTTNGRGGRVTSGTSAPHFTADFLRRQTPSDDEIQHGHRLAIAMELKPGMRIMPASSPHILTPDSLERRSADKRTVWNNNAWEKALPVTPSKAPKQKIKDMPVIPFRVLNAPALRDDYYCSLLAYSATSQCLAVGLGPNVYLWTETRGTTPTHVPESLTTPYGAHVTSVSFSSDEGGKSILAVGRADGRITLWSPQDRDPRFDCEQPAPVSYVSFRPTTNSRSSVREPSMMVCTEELLVGDEVGNVYYYSIEWPTPDERDLFGWHGSMTLLARISCHTQQVCGIAWSKNGDLFATGGNDNQLLLFEPKRLFSKRHGTGEAQTSTATVRNGNDSAGAEVAGQGSVISIALGQQKHLFTLNAAVKAIAFAPWQPSLIAAGGGSNDRCIHFFHAFSGATLATIDCHAQVTSLVWSERRKEIAATFGFAQPDHPYRVAVFAWPSCQRVVSIPWWSEERALTAIAYPSRPSGGPSGRSRHSKYDGEGHSGHGRRTREEGCLVIATSDSSIKFHEIWPERSGRAGRGEGAGLLCGSLILEDGISSELERVATIR